MKVRAVSEMIVKRGARKYCTKRLAGSHQLMEVTTGWYVFQANGKQGRDGRGRLGGDGACSATSDWNLSFLWKPAWDWDPRECP